MLKKILILLIIMSLSFAYADVPNEVIDDIPYDSQPVEYFENITFKSLIEDTVSGNWSWNVGAIVSKGLSLLFNVLHNNFNLISSIFIISIVSSVLLNLKSTFSSEIADGGFYAAYIIVAVLGAKGVGYAFEYGTVIANQLDFYIKTLIPIVMSFSIASGAVTSLTVVQPLIIGISQIVALAVTKWLIPMMTLICGMCVISSMTDKADLSGLIIFLHKAVRWAAGILMTAFVGIMTIQSMISPALDSVAGKITRYAISNFVPVVGGLISESVGIVAGYSASLRGAVGGAGIIVGIIACVKPLAEVASVAILYNLVSAVIRPVCDKRITSLLTGLGQVISTFLVLLIMTMLMFVVNICSAVNIGSFGGAY